MTLDESRLSIEELLPRITELEGKLWNGFDDRYGVDTYYMDYAKLGHRFAPSTILEIGVKYGYSAIALCKGSCYKTGRPVNYHGVDFEYFNDSNEIASGLMRRYGNIMEPWLYTHNILMGLPPVLEDQKFDLVHLDANHVAPGILTELKIAFEVVNWRGVIVIDDYKYEDVSVPVDSFLQEMIDTETSEDVNYVCPFSRVETTHNERGQLIIIMKKR